MHAYATEEKRKQSAHQISAFKFFWPYNNAEERKKKYTDFTSFTSKRMK